MGGGGLRIAVSTLVSISRNDKQQRHATVFEIDTGHIHPPPPP